MLNLNNLNNSVIEYIEAKTRDEMTKEVKAENKRPDSIINGATVMFLLGELNKARSVQKSMGAASDYSQGYKDGFSDGKAHVTMQKKPIAWAVISENEDVVRVYSQKPESIGKNQEVRPLFLSPNSQLSQAS